MKITWVFIHKDGSSERAVITDGQIPAIGDGKQFNGAGYKVISVVTGSYAVVVMAEAL